MHIGKSTQLKREEGIECANVLLECVQKVTRLECQLFDGHFQNIVVYKYHQTSIRGSMVISAIRSM